MARPRPIVWGVVIVIVVLAGGAAALILSGPSARPRPPRSHRAAGDTGGPVAGPAEYVGSAACARCHPQQHESFLRTEHSRSFALVDPDAEPPDVRFQHELSGREFEVRREGSQLLHGERLARDGVETALAAVHPVKYLVGSGHHTRTYLIEDDGFLAESPITWYASRQAWGMSPGYDHEIHQGFERATDLGCLICHVGNMEPVHQRWSRPRILELAIGCERCHGPGSRHVEQRSRDDAIAGDEDATIVHPGKLDRQRNESICAECHLRGDATVTRPGRQLTDFRPGMRVHDIRLDYYLKLPSQSESSQMKVVGHVEQLRLSRCYQGSQELTCTTCHDPHGAPAAEAAVEYYRARCLACHAESCRLPEPDRRRKSPADHCAACHMPQTETDIPHVAFTHHRITIPGEPGSPPATAAAGLLIALDPPAEMSDQEGHRNLGIAYLELSDNTGDLTAGVYRLRAMDLIKRAYAAGANDGELLAAMARLYWEEESRQALGFANLALQDRRLSDRAAVNALVVAADSTMRDNDLNAAYQALLRLVELRRHPQDWVMLGSCQAKGGLPDDAVKSLERAAAISPFRADIRRLLAEAYREVGRAEDARRQDAAALTLAPRE